MKNTLVSLGMPKAFSNDADFSGMTGKKDLYISNVIHQAYVGVDEEGTEAAAATAVVMDMESVPTTKIFRADHPFIFIIQQKDSGNILFMGRMSDPTKNKVPILKILLIFSFVLIIIQSNYLSSNCFYFTYKKRPRQIINTFTIPRPFYIC